MDLSNGSIMNRQPISVRNITPAIVKVEPSTVGSMVSGPSFPYMPSVPRAASQVVPSLQASSMSQQTSSGLQSAQSKYVKVWEGNLYGQRQGQPVFITRLEGYRSASAFETLAANWPPTMQIVRLYSQDHMNKKQYVGKADCLVFRAMNHHGFLGQLQEKKLCAVIQLPSQTLMLSVTDKACRLIGRLFPADMVVFKPQISSQQQKQQLPQMQQEAALPQMQQQQRTLLQQMQQQQQTLPQMQQQQQQQLSQMLQQLSQMLQQQQQQQQQQISQLQQQISQLQQMIFQLQQQQPQQQQMVGTGMGQAYVQGPNQSQLVSQGQVSSQGPQNMSGGGSMS
ncbi:hypothetical protein ACSBR2_035992 [Camellia fascicularis]